MALPKAIVDATKQHHAEMWREAWTVETLIEPDEWADAHIVLSTRDSAAAGPFRTSRYPYTRKVMRRFGPSSSVRRIVFVAARQVAKTTVFKVVWGWACHMRPSTICLVQPNLPTAKRFSKRSVQPFIEETPVLSRIFKKARDPKNTLLLKEFTDGVLSIMGGNSSSSLRGLSGPLVLIDETGDFKRDVEGKGDPIAIVEKSAATFSDAHIGFFGNPGLKGDRNERLFRQGDQQRYFVKCVHCGEAGIITWDGREWFMSKPDTPAEHHRIRWSLKEDMKVKVVDQAWLECGQCGRRMDERHKTTLLAGGEWRATAQGNGETESFHVAALYSPLGFQSWKTCATQFVGAEGDPELMRAFVNDVLGEWWEGETDEVEADALEGRRERFEAEVPRGVGRLTAGVDVQSDRLVVLVIGWGAGEEAWIITWWEIFGDPEKDDVWAKLDAELLGYEFTHASKRTMRVSNVCIDSGGKKGHTDRVYRYCKARFNRGVYAVKGGREKGLPLVGMPSMNNVYRTPLFVLCTDSGKITLMRRLAMSKRPAAGEPRPGFVHLPEMDEAKLKELCLQLTSERAVYGKKGRVWEKVGPRNHLWDCLVYALAALHILGDQVRSQLGKLAEDLDKEPVTEAPKQTLPAPFRPRPRKGYSGW